MGSLTCSGGSHPEAVGLQSTREAATVSEEPLLIKPKPALNHSPPVSKWYSHEGSHRWADPQPQLYGSGWDLLRGTASLITLQQHQWLPWHRGSLEFEDNGRKWDRTGPDSLRALDGQSNCKGGCWSVNKWRQTAKQSTCYVSRGKQKELLINNDAVIYLPVWPTKGAPGDLEA